MGDGSKIEWTEASWNPIRARNRETGRLGWHCAHASEGCRNCYAEAMNRWRGTGLDYKPGHERDVEIFVDDKILTQPLRWKRPRMIFVCSMTDLFADFVTDEMLDRVFAVMALCPQHTFQVLTKRPARMRAWFEEKWQGTPEHVLYDGLHIPAGGETGRQARIEEACEPLLQAFGFVDTEDDRLWTDNGECRAMGWSWPLPNVWLGTSVEDQATADARIPELLATPAAVRWISAEPLLGPVDLLEADELAFGSITIHLPAPSGRRTDVGISDDATIEGAVAAIGGSIEEDGGGLDWVVVGGESGAKARPMHPDWARSLRDQCAAAGVAYFFKQWGAWRPSSSLPVETIWRREQATVLPDGRVREWQKGFPDARLTDPAMRPMTRLGKARAGRLLDGVTHDGYPEVRG